MLAKKVLSVFSILCAFHMANAEGFGAMTYMQPTAFAGHNSAWGLTLEGGLILGTRKNYNELYGISVSAAHTDAGPKYGVGLGTGTYEPNGWLSSLRLEYTLLQGQEDKLQIKDGDDYHGLEAHLAYAGTGMILATSLGYLVNEDDSGDRFVSFGFGFGF